MFNCSNVAWEFRPPKFSRLVLNSPKSGFSMAFTSPVCPEVRTVGVSPVYTHRLSQCVHSVCWLELPRHGFATDAKAYRRRSFSGALLGARSSGTGLRPELNFPSPTMAAACYATKSRSLASRPRRWNEIFEYRRRRNASTLYETLTPTGIAKLDPASPVQTLETVNRCFRR